MKHKIETSWQKVSHWYNASVGEEGHYYHQKIIIPGILKWIGQSKITSMIDFGCGQGVLGRALPDKVQYLGLDAAPDLIKAAKKLNKNPQHQFEVADVTKNLNYPKKDFDFAAIILALQNIEQGQKVLENAARHLKSGGNLVIVLNHPCFRIPRQSAWGIDTEKKLQYRRIDRYMSSLKIPIQMHPGAGPATQTLSFHEPLSTYCEWLKEAGFVIESMAEWCSDKVSEGKTAKMENRAREEFPLFLAILAKKI